LRLKTARDVPEFMKQD